MSRWQLARRTIDASFRSFRFLRTKTFSIISSKLEDEVENLRQRWDQLRLIYSSAKSAIEIAGLIAANRAWAGKVSRWLGDIDSLEQTIKDMFTRIQRIHNHAPNFAFMGWPSRYLLAKDVIKTYKLARDLIKQIQRYRAVADNAFEQQLLLAYEVPVPETVGMDSMLKNLMDCINGEEKPGIIGLYGMGGSGKTTLMSKLHNNVFADINIRREFAQVIWIDVSAGGCDIDKIIDSLRASCKIDDENWEGMDRKEKARKIFNDLKGKKFILFMDGVGEEIKLQSVGVPRPKNEANQSKVFITTRSEKVCAQMKAKKFKVECLEENEALELLCMSAGHEAIDSEYSSLPIIAQELSQQCEGLPLALVTVGKAIAGRIKNPRALKHTLKKLKDSPWEVKGMVDNVFTTLKSSYDGLPSIIEKNCFLHFALFTESSESFCYDGLPRIISYVPHLIDLWIDKGLLGSHDNRDDASNHGEDVVESLKEASLVQDYGDSRVKMHNVVRNMALWLTREQDLEK